MERERSRESAAAPSGSSPTSINSRNIAETLFASARSRPDQVAVLWPRTSRVDRAADYGRWTYAELAHEVEQTAAGLQSRGIGPGVRTVLMVPPSPEFFVLTFALFHAGAIPVLVDPGMGLRNLKACLAEAQPQAFVGVPKAHSARLLLGWAKSTLRSLVTVGRRWGWSGVDDRQLRALGAATLSALVPHLPAPDELAAILFTSGSTGVPKGAIYTHENFFAQIDQLREVLRIEPGEVDLCTFPLFALFAPALGMTSIIPRMDATRPAAVDPRQLLGPLRTFGVTNLFGSPALINRLGRYAEQHREPVVPTLKRVLSAGAPVPVSVLRRLLPLLPPTAKAYTPYGATESLPIAVLDSAEIFAETAALTEAGRGTCVGRPVPGATVRIIRISDEPIATWSPELEVAPGEVGEIAVRGPMVTRGYDHRPELTALAKIDDAGQVVHRMGDLGYFDSTGRLWFCGRKSQRVITLQGTLFTEPIEGLLNAHPAVYRSALVGVPRAGAAGSLDREPVICIERHRSPYAPAEAVRLSDAELRRQLLERLALHDVAGQPGVLPTGPQGVSLGQIREVLFHSRFPVDIRHNSKIFREKLAGWAARRLGRSG